MKLLIVYSSRTGNTRRIAEAIFEILPESREIHPVAAAPLPDAFDFVGIGFWVNQGMADEASLQYMRRIHNQKVGLFGTLAAYPDSEHARECMQQVKNLLEENGNTVLGGFMCQGKVDPDAVEKVSSITPETNPMTAERRDRIEEAKRHPNEKDILNAQTAFAAILQKLQS